MNILGFFILLLVVCVVIQMLCCKTTPLGSFSGGRDPFTNTDKVFATKALAKLESLLQNSNYIPYMTGHELEAVQDQVYMALTQEQAENSLIRNTSEGSLQGSHPSTQKETSRENLTFFHPVNNRYWPYYFYSFPYHYLNTGAWPPGLFSRLYEWQPGFNTSGWSYWLRPGIYYGAWPRNRWVRNNNNYYFINNGHNTKQYRENDYYGSQA